MDTPHRNKPGGWSAAVVLTALGLLGFGSDRTVANPVSPASDGTDTSKPDTSSAPDAAGAKKTIQVVPVGPNANAKTHNGPIPTYIPKPSGNNPEAVGGDMNDSMSDQNTGKPDMSSAPNVAGVKKTIPVAPRGADAKVKIHNGPIPTYIPSPSGNSPKAVGDTTNDSKSDRDTGKPQQK